jgi:GH25 family lysozyme M1 (1,4-beta-N-acetylmuramidase)
MILATAPSMTPLPVYDWQEPPILQNWDWDCSEESIRWCMFAYGRTPDDAWMESSMIAAGVIDPAIGCTDASGAGLARWVNTEYGEYGYLASSQAAAFDQVAREADRHVHPLAMGGAGWYHWSGVRGYDAIMDRLLLANPAPGWGGVYQTMSRHQFANLGPFHLVRVTHPAAESDGGAPMPTGTAYGPDVSSHQGYVDWGAVRASGCSFGFTKATGGAWYANPTLAANWQGMASAGLARGAYHFAFETGGQPLPGPGPTAEADYFLERVMPLGLARGDMLVLDIEQGAGDLGPWALEFCRRVEAVAGFPPLIYTAPWFSDPHGFAGHPELARYGLWLADYGATDWPPAPAPWSSAAFWQFSDACSVPGISTPADGNRFAGPPEQLVAWGKPGTAPADDPYAQWSGLVGSGIIEMMRRDEVFPAQARSTFLPLGASPADIEQCMARDGCVYSWTISAGNQGFRHYPSE